MLVADDDLVNLRRKHDFTPQTALQQATEASSVLDTLPSQDRWVHEAMKGILLSEQSSFTVSETTTMMSGYELTNFRCSVIQPLLLNRPRGVLRTDDRRVLMNRPFWVLRTGVPLRAIPSSFGRGRIATIGP